MKRVFIVSSDAFPGILENKRIPVMALEAEKLSEGYLSVIEPKSDEKIHGRITHQSPSGYLVNDTFIHFEIVETRSPATVLVSWQGTLSGPYRCSWCGAVVSELTDNCATCHSNMSADSLTADERDGSPKTKDECFRLIRDLAIDYDGCETVESLKGLVDELYAIAGEGLGLE